MRIFRIPLGSLLLAAILSLGACASGPLVRTDADPTADFAQYRTWSFYQPNGMDRDTYGSWVSDRVREQIRAAMAARGYRYAAEGGDLQVNFYVDVRERTDVWSVPRSDTQWIYSYGTRTFIPISVWYEEPVVGTYRERTLTVDLVDGRRNRLVWTGAASAPERRSRTAEQKLAAVDAAIGGIFAKYPHQAATP